MAITLASAPPAAVAGGLRTRADEAYAAGQFRRAVELYSVEIRRHPDDAWLHLRLAFAYESAGDSSLAAIAASEATALSAELTTSLPDLIRERTAQGKHHEALVAARELVRLQPGNCAGLRTLAGLIARQSGVPAAQPTLSRAARTCPFDASISADHGRALLASGCASEAVTELERAVLLAPSDERARAALVTARKAVASVFADPDAELHALEQELALYAGNDKAALSQAVQQRWRGSLSSISRLSPVGERDPEVEIRLAEFYRLGRELGVEGAEERSLRHARNAVERRWTSAEALILLGSLELTQATPDATAAERNFLAALANDDGRPLAGAWSGLFFAHVALGRLRSAIAAAQQYLTLVPDDREFRAVRDEVNRDLLLAGPGHASPGPAGPGPR